MLLSKFLISINFRRTTQNLLKTVVKPNRLLSQQCSSVEKGKICPADYTLANPFRQSRCEKYKESLGNCSRTQSTRECKIGKSTDSQSEKCTAAESHKHAAEAFKQAYVEVKKDALNVQIFARNSINSLESSMLAENARLAGQQRAMARKKLDEIEARVDEIMGMSFKCGGQKKKEGYRIGDRIMAELRVWECENAAGVNRVKRRLDDLECHVKERTDTAVEIVRTCKGCISPRTLIFCVEASAKDAASILKTAEEYTRKEIANIDEIKSQSLRENDEYGGRLMNRFDVEVNGFLKHLQSCITELRKSQKK